MNYKYFISINQFAAYEKFGDAIDFIDLCIFDFIKDFANSKKCVTMQYEGSAYFKITRVLIMQNLPLIGIKTKQGISNRIEKLIALSIIARYENNKKEGVSFFKFGNNYDCLVFTPINESCPPVEKNDYPINESLQVAINESLQDNTYKGIREIKEEKEKEISPSSFSNSKKSLLETALLNKKEDATPNGLAQQNEDAEKKALEVLCYNILSFLGNNTTEPMHSKVRRKMREKGLSREYVEKQFVAYKAFVATQKNYKFQTYDTLLDAFAERDYEAQLKDLRQKGASAIKEVKKEGRNQNLG